MLITLLNSPRYDKESIIFIYSFQQHPSPKQFLFTVTSEVWQSFCQLHTKYYYSSTSPLAIVRVLFALQGGKERRGLWYPESHRRFLSFTVSIINTKHPLTLAANQQGNPDPPSVCSFLSLFGDDKKDYFDSFCVTTTYCTLIIHCSKADHLCFVWFVYWCVVLVGVRGAITSTLIFAMQEWATRFHITAVALPGVKEATVFAAFHRKKDGNVSLHRHTSCIGI